MTRGRDKVQRNIRLLEMALQEIPGDANLLMNYGLELVRSQRLQEGLRYYWQAFDALSRQPAECVVPELQETLLTQMCSHLTAAKDHAGLIRALQSPLAKGRGLTASMHFALGLAYLKEQQPAVAAAEMRQCLAKRNQPVLSPINPEIHRTGPRHCLALSLSAAGQAAEADQAFRQALAEDASAVSLRVDYARF
jgi:tetratricopeptide (TPR) repeat protein